MAKERYKGYRCPFCDHPYLYPTPTKLSRHVDAHHPSHDPIELERHVVQTRYPDLDIDALVQRYKDKLESLFLLERRGLMVRKLLRLLGILRPYNADLGLIAQLNKGAKTKEEVQKAFADQLVNRFRKESPEKRFEGYLNRDLSVLEKNGHAELIPAVRVLKIINFAKKQLEEAIDDALKESQEKPLEDGAPDESIVAA